MVKYPWKPIGKESFRGKLAEILAKNNPEISFSAWMNKCLKHGHGNVIYYLKDWIQLNTDKGVGLAKAREQVRNFIEENSHLFKRKTK